MKVSQNRGVAGGGRTPTQDAVQRADKQAFTSELARNTDARGTGVEPTQPARDAPSRRRARDGREPPARSEVGARAEAAGNNEPRDAMRAGAVASMPAAEALDGDVDIAALAASPVGRTAIGVAIAEITGGLDGPAAEASLGLLRKTLALMDYVDERRSDEVRRPSRFRSEPL